jgi:8-hydroxy-5-deazaflavin:NADPH oxidoreductase
MADRRLALVVQGQEPWTPTNAGGAMDIGILGSGHVGSSLATGFADKGHRVILGSRDPSQERLLEWAAQDPDHRRVGDYRAAVSAAELVILAVPGRVLAETLDTVGRDAFGGKIVVDPTNPFAKNEAGQTIDFYGDDDSGAEFLQRELPDVPIVKAFNQISAPVMLHPEHANMDVLRIAGDDEHAKRSVAELVESFGWRVRDLGPLPKARALEHGVIRSYRR